MQTFFTSPSIISWNDLTFYSVDTISIREINHAQEISSSRYGKCDATVTHLVHEISCTSALDWDQAAELFSMIPPEPGASLLGSTPLVLTMRDGTTYQCQAAALTQWPEVFLGCDNRFMGKIVFQAVQPIASAPVNISSATWPASNASLPAQDRFTAAWGVTSPWNSFISSTGFKVQIKVEHTPVYSNALGLVDLIATDLQTTLSCTPVGISTFHLATKLKINDSTGLYGSTLADVAQDLTLTSASNDLTLTMKQAALQNFQTEQTNGTCMFVSHGFRPGEQLPVILT